MMEKKWNCPDCGGTGVITCSSCDGIGEDYANRHPCTECCGCGYTVKVYEGCNDKGGCEICDGTGELEVECDECGGEGRVADPCSNCGGVGYIETCTRCSGTGNVSQ